MSTTLATLALVLTWAKTTFFVRFEMSLDIALIPFLIAIGVLGWLRRERATWWLAIFVIVIATVVADIVWITTSWHPAAAITTVGAITVAFAGLSNSGAWHKRGRHEENRLRVAKVTVGAMSVLAAAVISLGTAFYAITPIPFAVALRNASGYSNSFDAPNASTREVLDDGTLRVSNIEYGTDFANSFLDIYFPVGDTSVSRPTYVYVHGGGWVAGSKEDGDPAAGSSDGVATIGGPMLDAGYNVVFIDYALLPDAIAPMGARQLAQAVQFLQLHGAGYGLSTDEIILAGASGGANIVGQFALAQTDPVFARRTGIHRVMGDNLKAVVFDSGALDPTRVAKTQSPDLFADGLFNLAMRSYFRDSDQLKKQANIIANVSKNFPPTFLTDGNIATFPDQARDLHMRLDALGVKNEVALYAADEAELGHGYMAVRSRWTNDYNLRKIAFLATVTDR